jgi:serine/threonine protein kinase
MPPSTLLEQQYVIKEMIGCGHYATVRRCQKRSTQEVFALKYCKKRKGWENEITVMSRLSHKHIIRMEEAFNGTQNVYIIMELVHGGNLMDVLEKCMSYSEVVASQLMQKLLSVVAYLHENHVVHRDLKPENILLEHALPQSLADLKSSPHLMTAIKVADFGFARIIGPEDSLTQCCGTPYYIAPEVLRCGYYEDGPAYGKACDLWSVGVLGYVMLTGGPPFVAPKHKELFATIVKGAWGFPKDCALSEAGRHFLRQLLVSDPRARLTAAQALRHPWVHDPSRNSARQLPSVQATAAKFRQSITVGGKHSHLSRSWEHNTSTVAADKLVQIQALSPKARDRKLVIRHQDLAVDLGLVLALLSKHPSVIALDLSQEVWDLTAAEKILQLVQRAPGIQLVMFANGVNVQPSQLQTTEMVVTLSQPLSRTRSATMAMTATEPNLLPLVRCMS